MERFSQDRAQSVPFGLVNRQSSPQASFCSSTYGEADINAGISRNPPNNDKPPKIGYRDVVRNTPDLAVSLVAQATYRPFVSSDSQESAARMPDESAVNKVRNRYSQFLPSFTAIYVVAGIEYGCQPDASATAHDQEVDHGNHRNGQVFQRSKRLRLHYQP